MISTSHRMVQACCLCVLLGWALSAHADERAGDRESSAQPEAIEEIPLIPLAGSAEDEGLSIVPLVDLDGDAAPADEAVDTDIVPAPIRSHSSSAEPVFERPALFVGARAALLVPLSKVNPTGAIAFDLQWRPPIHDRRLGVSFDAGWYRLAGEGSQIDPLMGVFHFEWSAHGMPLHLGLSYEPPVQQLLPVPARGLWPHIEGGFALVPVFSFGTFTNEAGHVFLRDNPGRGLAFGFYLGAGLTHALGPGEIVGLYRWSTAYTDMSYPWINLDPGDLYGSQLHLGYRFRL